MPTRVLVRLVVLLLGVALVGTSPARADDASDLPVVVNDTVTLWPGQGRDINVLANDSDPGGDDLDVCRLPRPRSGEPDPPVSVYDRSGLSDAPTGTLRVVADPAARGTHTISYYVCNHTRLAPATLTVVVRPVAAVDVVAVRGRAGRIRVTNHNDRRVLMIVTDRAGCQVDVRARIGAHATRTFRVRRHTVFWTALIGADASPGIADRGRVRHIRLTRPAAPPTEPGQICLWR
ncbi:Ig-like domain-containing protein [Nocardioides sp. URHA0020]|uniref:Ig-like domain-containing protein n=1 Tax=Nocardioides sp. URHA0020 TaxID=1380392 RepID=UPI0004906EF1|nr:Ig-like domain-containing protein [Nocardioides sp. URHA0020]